MQDARKILIFSNYCMIQSVSIQKSFEILSSKSKKMPYIIFNKLFDTFIMLLYLSISIFID